MNIMASEMMKLGSRDQTVSRPEAMPSSRQVASGTAITAAVSAVARGPLDSPPSSQCLEEPAAKHAAHKAVMPTARSISAHSSTYVSPAATTASTAPCLRIATKVTGLRKLGATQLKKATSTAKLTRGAACRAIPSDRAKRRENRAGDGSAGLLMGAGGSWKKGTVPICRNGPEGALHKWGLSPFSFQDRATSFTKPRPPQCETSGHGTVPRHCGTSTRRSGSSTRDGGCARSRRGVRCCAGRGRCAPGR